MNATKTLVQKTIEAPEDGFNVREFRQDFPILQRKVYGKPLVYLDNAASTQKPRVVTESMCRFCEQDYANIHRGVHHLSQIVTDAYEAARDKVRDLLNAADRREIVFVRGATEAINLVSSSYGRKNIKEGDEILVSEMEHHANIVPWQMLCEETGARLRVAPINDDGEIILDELAALLNDKTKLVAVSHVSNALGTINPVKQIITLAHERKIPVLVDGAQATPHMSVDVQDLGCEFYVFSGHKMYGPTGIGALYAKLDVLETMPPYQGGGDMIYSVTFEKTIYNDLPYRFEAGTPNITGGIGLGTAIDYLKSIGFDRIEAYEQDLLVYGTRRLSEVPGLRIIGTAKEKAGVLSFVFDDIHPHDIGTILDREGVAIRTGHHCAQPVMKRFDVPATARASLSFYNTKEDIDALVDALHKVIEVFR